MVALSHCLSRCELCTAWMVSRWCWASQKTRKRSSTCPLLTFSPSTASSSLCYDVLCNACCTDTCVRVMRDWMLCLAIHIFTLYSTCQGFLSQAWNLRFSVAWHCALIKRVLPRYNRRGWLGVLFEISCLNLRLNIIVSTSRLAFTLVLQEVALWGGYACCRRWMLSWGGCSCCRKWVLPWWQTLLS